MFRGLRRLYGAFRQTLEDGHYCAEAGSIWSDIFESLKDKLPEMPKVDLLKRIPLLAKLLKSKIVWTAAFAAVSIQSVVAGALAVVGAGISFYAMEYVRCRRSRDEIMEEVNFAGQTVRGKRGDLCRLHKAQEKIMSLSGIFNGVAPGTSAKEIERVIDSVHDNRRRVLVVESGKYGASHSLYDFSEPDRKFAAAKELDEEEAQPSTPLGTGLKSAWDNRREDEVAERIIELERALPPQVIEKVRKRRMDIMPPAPPGRPHTAGFAL